MLLFVAPDRRQPIGGVKQIYRHVEILQAAGIEACVLHSRPGFRCDWFRSDAQLGHLGENRGRAIRRGLTRWLPWLWQSPDIALHPGRPYWLQRKGGGYTRRVVEDDDTVVYGEFYGGDWLADKARGMRVAVFNQNIHGTFRGRGLRGDRTESIYTNPDTVAVVTVSEHNQEFIRHTYPGMRVLRVINGVDSSRFRPRGQKRRQIAFMPRKLSEDLELLVGVLAARGALEHWTLAPIDGLDEDGVAEVLAESRIYLSTSSYEGFGLPPVEAGMCGCLVVGYTGVAAREFMTPGLVDVVPQGDVLELARRVEALMQWVDADPADADRRGHEFAQFLRERYSLQKEAESVLSVWTEVMASGPRGDAAP